VAVDVRDVESDVWVWNIPRGPLTRLTFNPLPVRFPVWSLDGLRIAFSAQGEGNLRDAFWQFADGTGPVEPLGEGQGRQVFPTSFSPDMKRLVVHGATAGGTVAVDNDIGIVSVGTAERTVTPLLATPFEEANGEVSPDGRWLAYESDESGQLEVFVRPFPDIDSGRWQVSTAGGSQPVWARNGRELFYRSGDAVMGTRVEPADSFVHGTPVNLFSGEYAVSLGGRNYDVSPDARRFLMLKQATPDSSTRFIIVDDWFSELERLVPVD
jgi:serine/threonine-protein kinase